MATKEELRELAAVQKELTQAINALKDAMSSSNEQAETRVELAEKELALAENRVEAALKQIELGKERKVSQIDLNMLQSEYNQAREKEIELQLASDKLSDQQRERLLRELNVLEEKTVELEKQKNLQKAYTAGLDDIVNKITRNGTAMNTSFGQTMALIKGINENGTAPMVEHLKRSFKIAGGMTAVVANIGQAMADLAKEGIALTGAMEELRSTFMISTGASAEMRKSFDAARSELAGFGVTAESTYEAGTALFNNFTDFTRVNKDVQGELVKTAAVLELNGVSAESFSKGTQLATKALGLTAEQAAEQQVRLTNFARSVGMAPGEIAEGFAQAGPTLAKFTINAEQAFEDLAKTSKVTGIEMGRILQIAEKFDTFDGAADQVGRLNAILGGDFINTLELMEAESPAERFQMLTDAVGDAGLAFEDMSYYEKLALTEAMGLQDVNELAMALSGNMDALSMDTSRSAESLEAMAERGRANLSVQKQLDALLTAMTPTFTFLADGAAKFLGILNSMINHPIGRFFGKALVLAALLVTGLGPLIAVMFKVKLATVAIVSAITALATVFFEEQYASNFLQGLHKIAGGFSAIGAAAALVKKPIEFIAGLIPGIGGGMKDIASVGSVPQTKLATAAVATAGVNSTAPGRAAAGGSGAGDTIVKVFIDGKEMTAKVVKEVKKEFSIAR